MKTLLTSMKTYLPKILAIAALWSGLQAQSASAQVIVNIEAVANNTAKVYQNGTSFGTGPNPLLIGNIGTAPERQRAIVKFNITQFAGMTISDATFDFQIDYVVTGGYITLPFVVDVYTLDYDKTAAAFVVGDLTTTSVTSAGSFNVSTTGTASFNITSALQTAVDNNFDYLSLKFINQSVETGPYGVAAYVGFNGLKANFNMTVDAIPEPTVMGLLGVGLLTLAGRRTSRRTTGQPS